MIKSVGQSQAISHHLAIVDHACVFRAHGALLVSEREIRASEQELARRDAKTTDGELRSKRFWVAVAPKWDAALGAPPTHTPDLGVAIDGGFASAEIELAVKGSATYAASLSSTHASGMTALWFPMQKAARGRLIEQADKIAAGRERVVDGRRAWWEVRGPQDPRLRKPVERRVEQRRPRPFRPEACLRADARPDHRSQRA
ncbi:MAG: hypothetical protein NVV66_16450 [Cellulomonas sp.]|uniref:hypothetical protein n=1 Tax=Cellulomonas sp. TaxID=40001 RepID=UPI002588515D|nr:hypothetical protein [Cellulomonas sp.]MCR6706206.1 hypothetical protein [Cellulomonas sp.]